METGRKKTGGRQKGTPNKVSSQLRDWVKAFLEKNAKKIERDFKQLSPKERVIIFEKLMKYCVPTLHSGNIGIEFENMTDEQIDQVVEALVSKTKENPNDQG